MTTYILNDNFNSGVISNWSSVATDPNDPVAVNQATGLNAMGDYTCYNGYLKLGVNQGVSYYDAGANKYKTRFELVKTPIGPNAPTQTDTAERWYKFDIRLPSAWNTTDNNQNIIVQWYAGGGSGSPAMTFSTQSNTFKIVNNYVPPDPNNPSNKVLFTEAVQKNVWQTFFVYYKWSYNSSDSPIIQIDRTINLVTTTIVNYQGINTWNSGQNHYWKVGNYYGGSPAPVDREFHLNNVEIYKQL